MRYENASRGHGSKERYLTDLVEVEKKMAVKPVEFKEGSPHEQRSAERQRRKTVAGQLGYQGAAAGFGAAATTAAAGKLAGTHVGQAHLKTSAKGYAAAGNKEAAKTVEDIARFGRWSKKHGKKAGAIVTGGTALATGAATMARVRGNEEQGMSQEIGQFKGGRKYKKDVTTLSKNFRLFSTLAAELDRGAPNINRARKIIDEHGKKIAIGAGGTAAGGGLIATGVSRKRRKKDEAALRAVAKAAGGKLVRSRTPFLSPKAHAYNPREGMTSYMRSIRDKPQDTISDQMKIARKAPQGPAAPDKVKRALSGRDYGETLGRLGRATRRQKKEYSALVHPLSGRVMDMRRGNSSSVGMGTEAIRTKSSRRMAELADKAKNPEVRQRALANVTGQNKNINGPAPVMVHNHPRHKGLKRAHPSAADTEGTLAYRKAGADVRSVVLSHHPNKRGAPQTKAVTTRVVDPDKAEHKGQRRISNMDSSTQSRRMYRALGVKGEEAKDGLQSAKYARRYVETVQSPGTVTRKRKPQQSYDTAMRRMNSREGSKETGFWSKETLHKRASKEQLNNTRENAMISGSLIGGSVGADLAHARGRSIVGGSLKGGTIGAMGAHGGVTLLQARRRREIKNRNKIKKREPLKTSVSEQDAERLVRRHGLKGPLPKGLTREQKMAAYEARYVSAGGRKSEKWDRKARGADKAKNVGLGVATAGGTAWLATRGKQYAGLKAIKQTPMRSHAENVAAAGAVVGGGAELYAGHARRKRSSYASAPGGVAASALRRMQDNTP